MVTNCATGSNPWAMNPSVHVRSLNMTLRVCLFKGHACLAALVIHKMESDATTWSGNTAVPLSNVMVAVASQIFQISAMNVVVVVLSPAMAVIGPAASRDSPVSTTYVGNYRGAVLRCAAWAGSLWMCAASVISGDACPGVAGHELGHGPGL